MLIEERRIKPAFSINNTNYVYGLCENLISQHHSSLLSDAKKAKELKDKLKKEIAYYKKITDHRKYIEKLLKESKNNAV